MRILTECGLVAMVKQGRERHCTATLEALQEVAQWAERYRLFWTWEMYDVTSYVQVLDLLPDSRIEITWGPAEKDRTRVEWTFEPVGKEATFVSIVMDGFKGDAPKILEQVSASASGFCWVLAGLKALLEFKVRLNVVGDRFPTRKC